MLTLISPAKKLNFDRLDRALPATDPDFLTDTKHLIAAARKLKKSELQKLMNLNDDLTDLNYKRFKGFKAKPTVDMTKQAALTFAGDTYLGLEAHTLGEDELAYAQDHLRILSGLYGLLRPLDLIQPYRLEMSRRLHNRRGENLYDFWGDKLCKTVDKMVADHASPIVVNLASNEYFKAARPKNLKARIVTPVFKEVFDSGRAKVIGFTAKKDRGSMARYLIQNRIDNPEDIKDFNLDRYKFQAKMSDQDTLVFTRKFIPVAEQAAA